MSPQWTTSTGGFEIGWGIALPRRPLDMGSAERLDENRDSRLHLVELLRPTGVINP
jgi:hypothetical protein